ncbi:carbohydrate ABC transporter permease [Paenibacillus roseipurpureus]|uniref:Carbohydrate ABC transporter permease n=1 Tax=Paenibacillus roseopurpureus TaxID=2918901 RepID=A0AA96LQ50_9BACL|nr:carbohydrate ABC transporter permease [Paenibacillus sp. MBLB1832]WNR45267.1 carbohydrate ABC transporter permease [Paenibacillus sp. MBLB1832]
MRTSVTSRWFQTGNGLMLALLAFTTVFPLLNVLAASLSSSRAISSGEVFLWPVEFTLAAYKTLINDGQLFVAMKNSVIILLMGTMLNMMATIAAAYPLSRKRLTARTPLLMMVTFTMLFSGGIIPNFILIKSLGLMNSYWALWIPGLISTYNMFVMKTFFEGLPVEMEESAAIDGANDLVILWQIILRVSMPIIASLALFYAVSWWNSYFNVLIYITQSDKLSLSVKLLQMIQTTSTNLLDGSSNSDMEVVTPEGIRASAIIISIAPILCVYPFLQKYFVKGVLIGSVKG